MSGVATSLAQKTASEWAPPRYGRVVGRGSRAAGIVVGLANDGIGLWTVPNGDQLGTCDGTRETTPVRPKGPFHAQGGWRPAR